MTLLDASWMLVLASSDPPAVAASEQGPASAMFNLVTILVAAALVTAVLGRLRLATIPGYLITGAIIGHSVLGLVSDQAGIQDISQLAIIFLMFGIGLHLDPAQVRGGALPVLLVGLVSTVLVVLAGWPIAMLFGLSAPAALVVALAVSISSTAVLLRVLQQRRELHSTQARICIGISIVQDLLTVLILAVLPLIAAWNGGRAATPETPEWPELVSKFALGTSGIVFMILLGRMLLPRLLRSAAKQSDELLLITSAAVALLAAVAARYLGFSLELGAFLGGFLLASTPFKYQLSGQLGVIRDLFMAVFFTAVGLNIDVVEAAASWWIILLAVAVVTVGKVLLTACTTWFAGASAPIALVVGIALANAGEFSLVVLAAASGMGIISPEENGLVIAVVVVTLIIAPTLMNRSHALGHRLARVPMAGVFKSPAFVPAPSAESETAVAAAELRHVILAGFGVVGRALAHRLDTLGVPYTLIELNPTTVRKQTQLSRSIVYGDVSNPEVLARAGIDKADAVILTIPDEDATMRACTTIRQINPDVFIAARTTFLSQGMRAMMLGADSITVEEVATAEAMERDVLARLKERRKAREAQERGETEVLPGPLSQAIAPEEAAAPAADDDRPA